MSTLPNDCQHPVLDSHVHSLAVKVRRRRMAHFIKGDCHDRLRGQHESLIAFMSA
jgi:hypothetical protein